MFYYCVTVHENSVRQWQIRRDDAFQGIRGNGIKDIYEVIIAAQIRLPCEEDRAQRKKFKCMRIIDPRYIRVHLCFEIMRAGRNAYVTSMMRD